MKKYGLVFLVCLMAESVMAQVGINTTTPQAQLEIKSSNEAAPANTDGLLIPKINAFPVTNPTLAQNGMLVYLTVSAAGNPSGFYYWNAPINTWVPVGNNNPNAWNLSGNAGTNPATQYVGTNDNTDLVLRTDKVDNFRIKNDGRIEIGNKGTNPEYLNATSFSKKLFVASETTTNNIVFQSSHATGDPVSMYFGVSRGSILVPTISATNQIISNIFFSGYDGTKFINSSGIHAELDGTPGVNSMPGKLEFVTTASGSNIPSTRMSIRSNGNIGVGTINPTQRLHVIGNIRMVDGNETAGRVLTSDATGTASWQDIPVPADTNDWSLTGNAGTSSATNFIGTTDDEGFSIRTNNAIRTRILATGEVGIGTTAPQQKLHISGPAGLVAARIGNTSLTGTTSNVAVDFFRASNANTDWRIYNIGPNLTIGNSGDDLATVNELYQFQGSRFIPMTDATISLGQAANRWNTLFASNGTINTSDAREKKNIQNLKYGLKELLQLRPVSFEWKKDDGSGTKLGLIAQELQKVVPEVVRDWDWKEDDQGHKTKQPATILGVYYSDLIPVLIKSIQDQQAIIDAQAKTITEILDRLEAIENKK